MNRNRGWRSYLSNAILLAFLFSGSAPVWAGDPKISWGISFSFLDVDLSKTDECRKSAVAPVRNSVFITRYDQPEIRSRVRQDLDAMKASGFRELRLVLFFGPNARSPDWFDLNDAPRAARLLRQFVLDVKDAGFSSFYLVYGVQGEASPKCRKVKWGDCYDPGYNDRVVDFISQLRQSLGTSPLLPARFDLAGEMCAPERLPEPLKSNLFAYSKAIIAGYTKRFPHDDTTMSCSLALFPDGRRSIDESFLDGAGRLPSFYAIHSYNRADENEMELVQTITRELERSRTPIVIAETSYDDKDHLQGLMEGLVDTTKRIHSIYFWPLKNHSSHCAADVAPPYTLDAAMGR